MDDIKLTFAANLIKLRTKAGLTQAELADKIHYSDKSISKWERGEALPDVVVMKQLSDIFGMTIDEMITEHNQWEPERTNLKKRMNYSQQFIILSAVAGIFTLCLLEFIIVWIALEKFHWFVLFAALPASLIVMLILNSIWYKGKNNMYVVMVLVASVILLAYLILLELSLNFWQILLVIIPAIIVVFFAFHIRRRKKPQNQADSTISRV